VAPEQAIFLPAGDQEDAATILFVHEQLQAAKHISGEDLVAFKRDVLPGGHVLYCLQEIF
jgi:hypothetical protein